jgi:flavin reductase (DIM6/NTAB) family NADH-FMN oxidoreductase RutF
MNDLAMNDLAMNELAMNELTINEVHRVEVLDPDGRNSPTRADDMPANRPYDDLAATVNTPMYVVTACNGEERAGCLVGFSVQCSIDPLHHLVCLSKANRTWEIAGDAEWLVVHALHRSDHALASLFGEHTDRELDKFTCCEWRPGPGGTPVLEGCDWFAGRIVDRVELGDHDGFVLATGTEGSAARAAEPRLGFQDVRDLDAANPA